MKSTTTRNSIAYCRLLAAALGSIPLTACLGSTTVPEDTVIKVATNDMDCDSTKLKVNKITDNNWRVTGCGKTQAYVCSGSNFMTDGMCIKN